MIELDLHSLVEKIILAELNFMMQQGKLKLPDNIEKSIKVTIPPDGEQADFATNAAMVLAKVNRTNPKLIAEAIADNLGENHGDTFKSIKVASPGFINLSLNLDVWLRWVKAALLLEANFSSVDAGAGEKVNIEYVSANPTGPLHVAHARSSVVGDVLANIMSAANYKVIREYYVNDAGGQIDTLVRSVYLRYREALGEQIGDIGEGNYPGEYLCPVGQDLAKQYGDKFVISGDFKKDAAELSDEVFSIIRAASVNAMMQGIKEDLLDLGIKHDIYFSERSLIHPDDIVAKMIEELKAKSLAYMGHLPPPKGGKANKKTAEDCDDENVQQANIKWQQREQLLFRSTKFGDEVDRPLAKPEGGYTYFGSDAAYHYSKLQRGADHLIDVLGADHGGYVTRISSATDAITGLDNSLSVVMCQMVRLFMGGEAVIMSKRAGQFVTLRDLINEVGKDAIRYMMIYRRCDAQLDFDLDLVKEKSRENPVFYVQYAHARIASVFRKAADIWGEDKFSKDQLAHSEFLPIVEKPNVHQILKLLARFQHTIKQAALHREPHRLAFYAYELAAEFHKLWTAGNNDNTMRFIQENDLEATRRSLGLLMVVKTALRECLDLIGVDAPDELSDG